MDRILKTCQKYEKNILFNTLLILIVFVLSHLFLGIFNVTFKKWVYYYIAVVLVIGVIAGIVQTVRKKNKKEKKKKLKMAIVTICIGIVLVPAITVGLIFVYTPEHIVYKNEKKYVVYVKSFFKTDAYYYDYINYFLTGKKLKIHEYYGSGSFDPFDEENKDLKRGGESYYIDYYE